MSEQDPQKALLSIDTLAKQISQAAVDRPRVLVGIDGPGASGKSTLAVQLAKALPNAHVVHVDDFYRPSSERGKAPGTIGALFDLARLTEQVVAPAAAGQAIRYQRYDWGRDRLTDWVEVPAEVPLIVEGVYSLESRLREYYTFTIFCLADRALRLARGLARDGEAARAQWEYEWMPAEDAYFEEQHPERLADWVIESNDTDKDQAIFRIVRTGL